MTAVTARELGLAERRVRREFNSDHPAHEKLVRHTLCRVNCTGRDIAWPNRPRIEQVFFSPTMGRPLSFSSYAYSHLCFDPDYRGWTESSPPTQLCEGNREWISKLPTELAILAECQQAAVRDENKPILDILPFVHDFHEARSRCIMSIIVQRLIHVSEKPKIPFVNQVLNLQ